MCVVSRKIYIIFRVTQGISVVSRNNHEMASKYSCHATKNSWHERCNERCYEEVFVTLYLNGPSPLYLPRKRFALGRMFTTHPNKYRIVSPISTVSLKWICECKTNPDSIPFSSGWVAKMCPSANHYQRSWSDDRARSLLNMRSLNPTTSSQSQMWRSFVQTVQMGVVLDIPTL